MIDHTGIAVADFDKAKNFYDATMGALGASLMMTVPKEYTGGLNVVGYGRDHPSYWLREGGEPGPGRHIAFTASNRAMVDAFYAAAMAAGGRDNGAPGLRPHYHLNYYGAFVFDPDGNNIEAVCHRPE
ncbi:catechol 2,3-dioxygenase-like lactoylglutathione lyase family enzyme [Pararhizobium capsulatum DSM 1112]|uniref:Catechol 2,3-dioxygenase-like lactoylglutathione lyase family enzyme n=1 Tax=Pararhizobium capsulatum DSM 1112 TaxID=1121113 RepID=A0ABU0BP82_9HYPH|nr:VOC family protein [Pararhizobium capsulatum]MDQ0319733.1 catechol 2,3-dioxygenase-like lactoylglutathione lyase family enzyme [Pararhizobium capsulatum DSM 1112]